METDAEAPYHSSLTPGVALISRKKFQTCRRFIERQPRSDPNIVAQLDNMQAIVDVLESAYLRLGPTKTHPDHYSVLQIKPSDATNRDLVRHQFKKLVRLLNPNKNKFPFADQALMRVREAWYVFSDPIRLDRFEREIRGERHGEFWTMCPYCWYFHEYERKYQDFRLRCGNCQSTFRGKAVNPPEP